MTEVFLQNKIDLYEYLAAHQASEGLSKSLLSDIKGRLNRVWKVEYRRESVTDHYHGYQLVFHVDMTGM